MRELSAIVLIYDIFEENGVAYTVSEWNDSITLRYFVAAQRWESRLECGAAAFYACPFVVERTACPLNDAPRHFT